MLGQNIKNDNFIGFKRLLQISERQYSVFENRGIFMLCTYGFNSRLCN